MVQQTQPSTSSTDAAKQPPSASPPGNWPTGRGEVLAECLRRSWQSQETSESRARNDRRCSGSLDSREITSNRQLADLEFGPQPHAPPKDILCVLSIVLFPDNFAEARLLSSIDAGSGRWGCGQVGPGINFWGNCQAILHSVPKSAARGLGGFQGGNWKLEVFVLGQ